MRGFPLVDEDHPAFSERHLETLLSAAEGESIHETMLRWGCSRRAVNKRRAAVVLLLGARNMIHAVALAYEAGILSTRKTKGPQPKPRAFPPNRRDQP